MGKKFFKLIFLIIQDKAIECINSHVDLNTNHENTFSCFYTHNKLQKMSQETLKCHVINLFLKINSDLHENDLYEELNLRKNVLQNISVLVVLKSVFRTN